MCRSDFWGPDFAPPTEAGFSILPPFSILLGSCQGTLICASLVRQLDIWARIWVSFGNTCWRNQRVHNRLQKSLLLWLSGQCSSSPKQASCAHLLIEAAGAQGLLGTQKRHLPLSSHVFTQSAFKGYASSVGDWLVHSLSALFDSVHFIQAGASESAVLLALHTHTLLKKKTKTKKPFNSQVSNQDPPQGFPKSLFQHQHCRAQWHQVSPVVWFYEGLNQFSFSRCSLGLYFSRSWAGLLKKI